MIQPLTTNNNLNLTLSLVFAHAHATSFGLPRQLVSKDDYEDIVLMSHVSNCCGSAVHFDLEIPYYNSCGNFCICVLTDESAG